MLALLLALGLLGGWLPLAHPARAASYSCDEAGLDAALGAGGEATFACAGPTTITVGSSKSPGGTPTTLDGGGLLTIRGDNFRSVFITYGGDLTLRDLAITGGYNASYGGGIYNGGTLTLANVAVFGNLGGGIFNYGTLTLANSTVASNEAAYGGGGIYNTGTLTVVNATVSGNTARQAGGGIYNTGMLTVVNATVSGNTTRQAGGGIASSGTATLTNATVSGNTASQAGGGISNGGTATLRNTIVAAPAGASTCDGAVADGGGNLETGATCGLTAATSRSDADPLLGPLAANGGPTQTHLPAAGSPAIGLGVAANCPLGDQRGAARPAGGACTSGAVEAGVAPLALAPPRLPDGTAGVAYAQQFAATGGTAPYTYAVAAGALPPGLALGADGLLAGTPTAGGMFAFTLRATDGGTGGGVRDYSLAIAPATVALGPATLPDPTVGAAYAATLVASGGTAPYTYAVTAGALPTGLTLAGDGALSGAPTAGGTFSFTVTATDGSGGSGPYSGSRAYTLTVNRAGQVIAFGTPTGSPAYTVGDTFTVGATASSGLPVGFAASGACTVAGTTVTTTQAGTCTVVASQPGDADYAPASDVTRTFGVDRAAQTIDFATPGGTPSYTVGQTFVVGATASSGLPVTFAAGPGGVCAVSGTTVTALGAGTCAVTAGQPGDATHAAAPDVTRTFAIVAPTPTPSPSPAPARPAVAAAATGGGTVSPAGTTAYAPGTLATYRATPDAGHLFLGWTLDGRDVGFASPLDFTVAADRTLVARFAVRPAFADVPTGGPAWEALTQLAARGVIKGYGDGNYGPTDMVLRAQAAALLVRAFGWDNARPNGPMPFSDVGTVDPELQRAIAILAQRGIAQGYGDGTYGPTDAVTHAQAISLITRSMVQVGYWIAVTQDDPRVYPNVPLSSGHRLDLLTFAKYAGALPDRPSGAAWADWATPASRGWTARVLWQALGSEFGVDRVP